MVRGRIRVGLWLVYVSQLVLASEIFDEQLRLRPLQDGRLYTHFTFTTLLEGASPRSPESLQTKDERKPTARASL